MIIKLEASHKETVLEFCYLRERENLFAIGSFNNYPDTFAANRFFGAFENDRLIGLGVYFSRFGNLVINAQEDETIRAITDFAVADQADIRCVAAFKKYAETTIRHLKKTYGKKPKKLSRQTVLILAKANFHEFLNGAETIGTPQETDDIVVFSTGKQPSEITEADREKIFPNLEFLLRRDNKIVSKANIHGLSEKYFQIGGVLTSAAHRRKGYARQVVSSLCTHYFAIGKKYGLLFTGDDNIAAQKLYLSIGFKPSEEFLIAEY